MKFQEKYSQQLNNHERKLLNLAAEVISGACPTPDPEVSTLRQLATGAYRTLLGIDSDEGDGHLKLLRLTGELKSACHSLKRKLMAQGRTPEICFNPHIESPDRLIEKVLSALQDYKELKIVLDPPLAAREKGWDEFCTVRVRTHGKRWSFQYHEMGGFYPQSPNVRSYIERSLDIALREHAIHLAYYQPHDGDSAGPVYKFSQEDESRFRRVNNLSAGASVIPVSRYQHNFGGIEYSFSFERQTKISGRKFLKLLLEAMKVHPHDALLRPEA